MAPDRVPDDRGEGQQEAASRPCPQEAASRPCPICRKPPTEKMRPFCSKRCADVDLHRWLGGVYAVPGAGDAPRRGDGEDDDTF